MKILSCWLVVTSLVVFTVGCGSDSSTAGAGGVVVAPPFGCDPLTPSYCAFPYPNDYWTVADSTTVTGLRLALPDVTMPATRAGVRSNPDAFNEMDGFSPGIAAMTHFAGATVMGLATPDSIQDSLNETSPTVILNTTTGERLAHWVDLDEYVVQAKLRIDAGEDKPQFTIDREIEGLRQEQALMLRPAIRPEDATRYIVAIRNVRDGDGEFVAPSPGFQALRDDVPSSDAVIESRRAHFEEIFSTLEDAGISRDDLQIAWDFTTTSRENNTSAMLHIRDDALERFPDGVPYTIELKNEDIIEGIACRLEITFDMPLYMTKGESGGLLNLGANGLPEQNGTFAYAAAMIVPVSVSTEPASLVEFGHGQLGAKEQVLGFQEIAAQANFATFGLDWKGFASDDVLPTLIPAIVGGDMSAFRAIPERMHQGFLNFLMAMRTLSREAEGGASTALNQALANDCGGATIDGSKRYYFGGSQGGILGGSLMALTTDIERGLLAVPGQSYNLLLNRSVNFDEFAPQFYSNYDWNALDVQMNLASGDDVMNIIRPVWGLDVLSGPHVGSAMIEVDFGNPEAPITNIPHWSDTMKDPHGRATELRGIGDTLLNFYETGVAENSCNGPCDDDDILP